MASSQDEKLTAVTKTIVHDCLQRALEGDPNAGFDLAKVYLAEQPNSEVQLLLAVVEVLFRQSAQLGSKYAQDHLEEMWPQMRSIMLRRLTQRGFKDEWGEKGT